MKDRGRINKLKASLKGKNQTINRLKKAVKYKDDLLQDYHKITSNLQRELSHKLK